MMRIKSVIAVFVTLILCLFLVACEPNSSEKNSEMYKIYMLAKDAGYDGSYEKWLETIKGEDGKTPYNGENGNWWIGDSDTGVNAKGEKCSCENGLSAYELYLKHNPFYKRTEEEWVNDLAEGKLKGKFVLENLSEVLTREERFPYMVKGTICLIDSKFIIIEDETGKALVKHKGYSGNKGDIVTITGTLIKENNILVFDEDSIVDIKSVYENDVPYNPILDELSNENISSVKYVNVKGKLNAENGCYVELLKNKFNILNYSKEYDLFNGHPVNVFGYVIGKNNNYNNIYITNIEEIKINSINIEIEIDNNSLGSINEKGLLTAIAVGKIKIRATYAYDSSLHSDWVKVNILKEPAFPTPPGLRGYEIVIMTDNAKNDDPFYYKEIDGVKDEYTKHDKIYKQKAWREVEQQYDYKIVVKEYPDVASWGAKQIKWIIDNAEYKTSQFDLGLIVTDWIPQLGSADVAIDTSELYERYGMNQMTPFLKSAGTYNGKLLVASPGLDFCETHVNSGLFYNYGWIKKLEVEDPAKMFNDGYWTYSNFKEWICEVQLKLGENEYVLEGDPYCYWQGMSNIVGISVCDSVNYTANLNHKKQQEASKFINSLMELGYVMNKDTNSSFENGKVLMTTGNLQSIKNENEWSKDMWGKGKTEYGYVPFPYPDDFYKEDTKVSISSSNAYLYVTGRTYPEEIKENAFLLIWCALNRMFYKTSYYVQEDPKFDYKQNIIDSLDGKLDNSESIEAIMYYTEKRVIFDPTNAIYESVLNNPLKDAAYNVLYEGKDYNEEFNKVKEQFELKIKQHYCINNS